MRLFASIIAATLLLITPGAVAGPGGSAETFEDEETCWAERQYDSGSSDSGDSPEEPNETEPNATPEEDESASGTESYWYTYSNAEGCEQRTTYAGAEAHDDEGSLASVQASGGNGTADEQRGSGSFTYADDGSWSSSQDTYESSYEEGWDRTVEAETTVGQAELRRGCDYASTHEHRGSSWHHDGDRYSSHSWSSQSTSTYDDRCADEVSVSHEGRDASLARENVCQSEHTSDDDEYETWYGEEGWYRSERREDGSWSCNNGASATGANETLWAGFASECDTQRHESRTHYWAGNNSTSYGHGWSESACFNGALVEGPAGSEARAGFWEDSWEDCETAPNGTEECYSGGYNRTGATIDWEQSPAGPTHVDMRRGMPG